MARKMTEWPSKRGPITKIMPSDGCIGDTVPLAVGKWYDFHEFGWYMGNVGSNNACGSVATLPRAKTFPSLSLTQKAVSSFETSNPTYSDMVTLLCLPIGALSRNPAS